MKFSVVMPIHNEEQMLPYSLPSVYRLKPQEVILLFDRCTDDSLLVAKKIARQHDFLNHTRFVEVNRRCGWSSQLTFLRMMTYRMCKNDVVLNTDADIILSSEVKDYASDAKDNLVMFERIDYPISPRNVLIRFLQRTPLSKLYSKATGIYMFNNRILQTILDDKELSTIIGGEDAYIQSHLSKICGVKFVLSNCLHLRPRETKHYHYVTGYRYWKTAKRNFLITAFTSFILLKPHLLLGYIHARKERVQTKQPKFSVVMPVKDEVDLIKYSLPALYQLNPDEIVLVVEPLGELLEIINHIAGLFPQVSLKLIVLNETTPNWRDRHAYARRKGFLAARNDLIFTIDVDKVVDPRILDYFHMIGHNDVRLVSFNEVPKGFSYAFFIARILRRLGYKGSFTGTYAVSKKAWLETEDEESAKQIFSHEDTHLHEHIKRRFKTVFCKETRVLDLRPVVEKRVQFLAGVEKKRHGKSLIKVLVSSMLSGSPLMLVGFLKGEKLINESKRFR